MCRHCRPAKFPRLKSREADKEVGRDLLRCSRHMRLMFSFPWVKRSEP